MKKLMGILVILLGVTAGAQTVTQGDVKTMTATAYEFHSPMIIETVFAPVDQQGHVEDQVEAKLASEAS